MIRSSAFSLVTELITIKVRHWPRLDELERFLAQDERHLMIGLDAQSPNEYVSLCVDSADATPGRRGTIGIICDSYSLDPCVAVLPSWGAVLVAVNTICSLIRVDDFVASTIEFDTPVHDILLTPHGPLVETEIGIVALDSTGHVRWACEHDLLESVSVVDTAIDIAFQDGTRAQVDIRSGKRNSV